MRRYFFAFLLPLFPVFAFAQFVADSKAWIGQLDRNGGLPDKLLSTRTAVFYDYTLTAKELKAVQENFQRTGIDAVVYFETDMVSAGTDVTRAFALYLQRREVTNLFFVEKDGAGYRITMTTFNGKDDVISPAQKAWSSTNAVLADLLKEIYRIALNQQQRQNLLINGDPEPGLPVNPIMGKRNEFYAIDAKVDPLAVPMTGDSTVDRELERIFADNYSLKYKLTPPGTPERDLRKQGLLYVVGVVRTRDIVAQELLGYTTTGTTSEIISTTYPDTLPLAKKIGANTPVYKFYFKHIDSGNVFLGTKWDADETWQEALLNQLRGMKTELRLN